MSIIEDDLHDTILRTGWTIPTDAVLRTYRGRVGCGCGCKGSYSFTKRAATIRSRFVMERINYAEVVGPFPSRGEDGVDVPSYCLSYENDEDDVAVWVYVRAEALPTVGGDSL